VIDRKFAPGDYRLSLTAKPSGSGAQVSGQSVNVTIASNAQAAPAEIKVAAMPAAPAPIFFAYDEAKIASIGRNQAAALGEFLRQRQLAAVTLTGHADERGSDAYNMAAVTASAGKRRPLPARVRLCGQAGAGAHGQERTVRRRRPRQAAEGRRFPAGPARRAAPAVDTARWILERTTAATSRPSASMPTSRAGGRAGWLPAPLGGRRSG